MDDEGEEQQYCLRWNNFQANITSQFEALRDDEDFTDVSIVCEGRSIKAHRVVLSACSPLFKEMFKNNPCSHPIIFMRDVDARSVSSLLEFMYAGEVNVAQAHLSNFLRTAESLKIRGLTDPHTDALPKKQNLSKCTSTTNSEVALPMSVDRQPNTQPCKQITQSTRQETDRQTRLKQSNTEPIDPENNNETLVNISHNNNNTIIELEEVPEEDITMKQMKIELPEFSEYFSDVEEDHEGHAAEITALTEVEQLETLEIPQSSGNNYKTHSEHGFVSARSARIASRACRMRNWTDFTDDDRMLSDNHIVKLADGVEVHAAALRSVKWSDYRKLTRGLATILFRPEELASCSVTGQRWSRAGTTSRPVKPALDRAKVQAIISYVASRFPMVEISRIKQVLAYKCKENSTAFKMKAVRYFSDQIRDGKAK